MHKYDENAYKPIPMKPVKIDLSGCKTMLALHEALKEQFGLPDYYGKNWSALFDLLRDFADEPTRIEVYGLQQIPKGMNEQIQMMLDVFEDVHTEAPHIDFVLVD